MPKRKMQTRTRAPRRRGRCTRTHPCAHHLSPVRARASLRAMVRTRAPSLLDLARARASLRTRRARRYASLHRAARSHTRERRTVWSPCARLVPLTRRARAPRTPDRDALHSIACKRTSRLCSRASPCAHAIDSPLRVPSCARASPRASRNSFATARFRLHARPTARSANTRHCSSPPVCARLAARARRNSFAPLMPAYPRKLRCALSPLPRARVARSVGSTHARARTRSLARRTPPQACRIAGCSRTCTRHCMISHSHERSRVAGSPVSARAAPRDSSLARALAVLLDHALTSRCARTTARKRISHHASA